MAAGSVMPTTNLATFAAHADALIVGSACKVDGYWKNPIDTTRTRTLVETLRAATR